MMHNIWYDNWFVYRMKLFSSLCADNVDYEKKWWTKQRYIVMTVYKAFTAWSMVSPDMETMLFNWSGDVDKTNFSCLTWTSLSHDGNRRTHSWNRTLISYVLRITGETFVFYARWVWCSADAISSALLRSVPIRILFAGKHEIKKNKKKQN